MYHPVELARFALSEFNPARRPLDGGGHLDTHRPRLLAFRMVSAKSSAAAPIPALASRDGRPPKRLHNRKERIDGASES